MFPDTLPSPMESIAGQMLIPNQRPGVMPPAIRVRLGEDGTSELGRRQVRWGRRGRGRCGDGDGDNSSAGR